MIEIRTKCLSTEFQLAFPCRKIKMMITRLEHAWTLQNARTSSYAAASCRYMSWKCYIVCVYCFKVVVLVLDISNNLKTTALDSRLHAAELMTCWEQTVWILYILVSFSYLRNMCEKFNLQDRKWVVLGTYITVRFLMSMLPLFYQERKTGLVPYRRAIADSCE